MAANSGSFDHRKPPSKGRPKGAQNKVTTKSKEAVAAFFEANVDRFQGWLDEVAKKDPERAYRMVYDLAEFHLPKLARNEHTGKDGGEINLRVTTQDDEAIIARYLNNQQKAITND